MSQQPNRRGTNAQISRRKALTGIASGTGIFLAGCSGDSEGDGATDGDTGSGSDGTDETGSSADIAYRLGRGSSDLTQESNWNPWNLTAGMSLAATLCNSRLAEASFRSGDYFNQIASEEGWDVENGLIAQDWEVGDDKLDIMLQDDWQWSNGNEVSAEDLDVWFTIDRYFDNPAWDSFTETEVVDEKTWRLNFDEALNERVLLPTILNRGVRLNTPRGVFSDYRDRLVDAQPDYMPGDEPNSEVESVLQELSEMTLSYDDVAVNGPLEIVDISAQEMILQPYDGHPASEHLEFEEVSLLSAGGNRDHNVATLNNENDYSFCEIQEIFDQVKQNDNVAYTNWESGQGSGLMFNLDDDIVGDVRVRKGLLYLMDHERIANSVGGPDFHGLFASGIIPVPSSVWSQYEERFPEKTSAFEKYRQNVEKGEQLLNDAGLQKDGGTWYTPSGDELQIEIMAPPWGIFQQTPEAASRVLQAQGINAAAQIVEGTTYTPDAQAGDYQIASGAFGDPSPSRGSEPYYSLVSGFLGWRNALPTYNPSVPEVLEVPPVGEPDGNLREFNWREARAEMATADDERYHELALELMWAQNQIVPNAALLEGSSARIYRTDRFEWPDQDHELHGLVWMGRDVMNFGWPKPK